MKKIIGIAGNLKINKEDGIFIGEMHQYTSDDYVKAVIKGGGIPIIIPVMNEIKDIEEIVKYVDGIILTGGYDIDPQLYNENPIHELEFVMRNVDDFFMNVIKCADNFNKPILGICKGHQALNVYFGGTLYQDLKTQNRDSIKHNQDVLKNYPSHKINIQANSCLFDLFGNQTDVNSFHHQAVKKVADGFEIIATSDDGVVESIEKKQGTYMLGVQWHPEMMLTEGMIGLMKSFLKKC